MQTLLKSFLLFNSGTMELGQVKMGSRISVETDGAIGEWFSGSGSAQAPSDTGHLELFVALSPNESTCSGTLAAHA